MTSSSSTFLHAVLGPTNTGKTHYALSRMLGYESGIIGFPLRLLARENYETLVRLKGEDKVALITGEEKIIPPKAKWFSCTVESMPLDRKFKFIAIDEIQLAGDPDRGHIFTDRLLHARGKEETLFLGAETMRPLLKKLLPKIVIDTRARLSKLTYTDPVPLNRLPPRTAIVAFSASEVYTLAETIRQKKGGCAIIMGRLSPRTRNAQIELYQKGEVDYLVATDAIGMGLNMDVDHVVLSSLRKFDGRTHRSLTLQEIAQIAGRAGRGMKDGTFGTITHSDTLLPEIITAIEGHNFAPLKQIYWRQNFLDFANPLSLLHSLQLSPPQPELIRGRETSDLAVLSTLINSESIRHYAFTPKTTRILWEVCQIPDFKKLGDDSHAQLCAKLFSYLVKDGKIPAHWIEGQLRTLNQCNASIDTLMQRLQSVRICSYVAAHQYWLPRNGYWQAQSRNVENNLSDALHERLIARFVNKRAVTLLKQNFSDHKGTLFYNITKDKLILIEGHEIGRIKGFTVELDKTTNQAEKSLLLKTARQALHSEMPSLIRHFMDEKPSALSFHDGGMISWDDVPIGYLKRGETYFTPELSLFPGEFRDRTQRQQVFDHLQFLVSSLIENLVAPLHSAHARFDRDPVLRGILHRLQEDGGLTLKQKTDRPLTTVQRRIMRHSHIVCGERYIYCAPLFHHPLPPLFTHLHALWHQREPEKASLSPGILKVGAATLSIQKLEKVLALLSQHKKRSHNVPAPRNLASLLGVKQNLVPEILTILNITYSAPQCLSKNFYGPAAPLMLKVSPHKKTLKKQHRNRKLHPHAKLDTPFGILKGLRLAR